MLERKISHYIEHFYEVNRGALLLAGARQIGKTYSIRKFAKEHFKSFIEINFVETPEAIEIFSTAQNSNDILLRLSVLTDKPLIKDDTIIFFDEVQLCPEIVTAIKFLVDDGRYRYILSGSLLGVELNNLRSTPVGYMAIKDMYPLDLEEFMWAVGVNKDIIATLKSAWENKQAVDDFVHRKMMEIFRLYLIVGGMPDAVNAYKENNNLQDVIEKQREIIRLYRKDISQYDIARQLNIKEVFDLIPSELNSKNKRFFIKDLNTKARMEKYKDEFLWLKDAGVAIPVYNIEEPKSPLKLASSRSLFKLFSNDVGLLACQYSDGIQLKILTGNDVINHGSIFENVVTQELHAHGFNDLYYYNSKKMGEVDFVVELNGEVCPIEVKSGKDYARHRALNNILNCKDYTIPQAIVLCNDNYSIKDKVSYMPIYMVMFINKEQPMNIKFSLDLSGL
ncbi:MAG: ATP-binding protein [Muribaculaceae bacterium]|nr:ATP-binding protein [Muribaculaceae bacterium]